MSLWTTIYVLSSANVQVAANGRLEHLPTRTLAPTEAHPQLAAMPAHMVLAAPFTPFKPDCALNATAVVIDALAAQAAQFGVTVVWIPGSMGQFEVLTMAERKELLTEWVRAGHANGLYVIAHVGTTVLADAQALAAHAAAVGADAIASVPPYYEPLTEVDTVVEFLGHISAAAPLLPLFYYHLPGRTGVTIKVADLLTAAAAPTAGGGARLPALAGVKFVSGDTSDWFDCVTNWNSTRALMYAPEPKLASFGLGRGRGVVLAEDFYAPTYLRMLAASDAGNASAAAGEQAFKLAAVHIVSNFSGAPRQWLYRRFPLTRGRFVYGPPRLPQHPMAEADWPRLQADLDAIGFWQQGLPPRLS